jgi:hypothetical protein
MNENYKSRGKAHRFCLIIGVVLLAWAVGGTIIGVHFHGKYESLQATIDNAGGSEFVDLAQRHGTGLISHLEDISAIRGQLESANGAAAELEQRNQRAYDLAKQSDDEFIEFRSTVASSGSTISTLIANQQRIIDIVGRIERNNQAVKIELGVRP